MGAGAASMRGRVAVLCAFALIPVACSLPADDRVTQIDPDRLPAALANTTTTSTTTTTTSTVAPASTSPLDSSPTTSTSTTLPTLTAPVSIFYTISGSDDLQSLRVFLPEPVSLRQVIAQLETPSSELSSYNLRSSVRRGLIDDVVLDRAVLTVSLDRATFEVMADVQRRRAVAQIVLTFTSFATSDAGAVGFVRFEIEGEPISVFVPASDSTTEPGAPLAFADFQQLVVNTTPVATPTTTTSTSVPDGSIPDTATTAPPAATTPPP